MENVDAVTCRPWSQLPAELLRIVAAKITSVVDFIQFRSVCTSWHSNSLPTDLRSQLPHLLLHHDLHHLSSLAFFDLSDYKISNSNFSETLNKTICGSSFGYIALINEFDSALSLFNPFIRAQILLPPPSSYPYYLGAGVSRHYRQNDETEGEYSLVREGCVTIRKGYPWKVSLSADPLNDECVVVVTLGLAAEFAFCKIGDKNWTVVDTTLPWSLDSVYCYKRRFYVFDDYAVCLVYDSLEYGQAQILIPSPDNSFMVEKFHVVVREDLEMFMVLCYKEFDEIEQPEMMRRIRVFKLDETGEEMRWVKVDSIGGFCGFSIR